MSGDITSPDGEATAQLTAAEAFAGIDWAGRLRDAAEQVSRKKASRRNERAGFAERRDYGLVQRHARKQAHIDAQRQGATMEPKLDPTDIIGAKGWCWNCQHTVVYDAGPEGDFAWQHANPSVPDDHELQEITIPTDRIRMFQHGRSYASTQTGAVR